MRVSMSSEPSACSGLMYSGVPIIAPSTVKSVSPAGLSAIALAMPKSMTLACGFPSWVETRTFDGLMSRWMIPFVWACWTALQTWAKSSSRASTDSPLRSQYSEIGAPTTRSITK